MQVNGIEIPDGGTTVQRIPDPLNSRIAIVTTTVVIDFLSIEEAQADLDAQRSSAEQVQNVITTLTADIDAYTTAAAQILPSPAQQVTPYYDALV